MSKEENPEGKMKKHSVPVEQRTDEELQALAKDMVDGKVFFDGQLPEEYESFIPLIFMPLTETMERELVDFKKVGMIFEYLDKRIPIEEGTNPEEQPPKFSSMNFVHVDDMEKLHGMFVAKHTEIHGEPIERESCGDCESCECDHDHHHETEEVPDDGESTEPETED